MEMGLDVGCMTRLAYKHPYHEWIDWLQLLTEE